VVDGDRDGRARPVAVLEALRQLGALTADDARALAGWLHPDVRNHRGEVVGQVAPALRLKEAQRGEARELQTALAQVTGVVDLPGDVPGDLGVACAAAIHVLKDVDAGRFLFNVPEVGGDSPSMASTRTLQTT